MTIKMSTLFRRSVLRVLSLTLFVLSAARAAPGQTETLTSGNWWNPSPDRTNESGKLSELALKKKVYVIVSFKDARTITEPSPTQIGDVLRAVLDALSVYKDLQAVSVPSQADFAIRVLATATTDTGDRLPNLSLALDPSTAGLWKSWCSFLGRSGPTDESISCCLGVFHCECSSRGSGCHSFYSGRIPRELSKQKERTAAKSR